jgi:hypothetical protein
MKLTAEQIARELDFRLSSPDKIPVRVRIRWHEGICLPVEEHEDADGEERAVFKVLTYGDNTVIEHACRFEVDDGDDLSHSEVDVNEVRRLIVRRNLLSWSLPIPIERESGWLTEECYERVGRVSAPLVDAFLDGFEEETMVSSDEEDEIAKQCAILFSKSGRGVSDACDAVSLFCTLGNFAEKFNMDPEKLAALPYRDYLRLRLVTSHEVEAMKRDRARKATPNTRIVAGHGGRTRQSAGIKRPL